MDFLTDKVTAQLMISLVLSKMDYCNSLLTGLPDNQINKLQRVQNCAAKVCFRKRKYDHATPLLKSLHWLPVKERIDYKIATLCYKTFTNSAPKYICDLLETPKRLRELRSSKDYTLLKIPSSNLKTYGERSFSFYGPSLWNTLPREIREAETLYSFKRYLKHYLFLRAFDPA